jgi:hypothetical protein
MTRANYLAGLWKEDLAEGLLWQCSDGGLPSHKSLKTVSWSSSPYRAPTWSWASVDVPVRYISVTEHKGSYGNGGHQDVKFRHANITPHHAANPMGKVSKAEITVTAYYTIVYLQRQPGLRAVQVADANGYIYADAMMDAVFPFRRTYHRLESPVVSDSKGKYREPTPPVRVSSLSSRYGSRRSGKDLEPPYSLPGSPVPSRRYSGRPGSASGSGSGSGGGGGGGGEVVAIQIARKSLYVEDPGGRNAGSPEASKASKASPTTIVYFLLVEPTADAEGKWRRVGMGWRKEDHVNEMFKRDGEYREFCLV